MVIKEAIAAVPFFYRSIKQASNARDPTLTRMDHDDRSAFLASCLGEGKDHHQEREQRLRLQVTFIDPEQVVLIGNFLPEIATPSKFTNCYLPKSML